jgi:hypothetical protein
MGFSPILQSSNFDRPMSYLGQKRTWPAVPPMSRLRLKADACGHIANPQFKLEADKQGSLGTLRQ